MGSGDHRWWISSSLSWKGDVFRIFGFYEPVMACYTEMAGGIYHNQLYISVPQLSHILLVV